MPASDATAQNLEEVSSIPTHLWRYAQDQDRLIKAAAELRVYLLELAQSASITVHAVDSRAKSLSSYQNKASRLDAQGNSKYSDPASQIQDCIAARVIVFTTRAREDLLQILESRLVVVEKRNPGREKFNGYDSEHLIVTGLKDGSIPIRLPALTGYLDSYAGLEVQLRSVASHAWAEYEHDVRYKGGAYEELSPLEKGQIDQWFIEAGGMRSVMDSLFARIEERLAPAAPISSEEQPSAISHDALTDSASQGVTKEVGAVANPSSAAGADHSEETEADRELYEADQEIGSHGGAATETALTFETLESFINSRFPSDRPNQEHEIEVLLRHLDQLKISTIEELDLALSDVDELKVARLMDYQDRVSRVRRLDDLLLAIFKDQYIETSEGGEFANLLRLRLRRVRGNFAIYSIRGAKVETKLLTAAGAVRRLAAVVAAFIDATDVQIPGVIAWDRSTLNSSARTTLIRTKKGDLWVATNLSRSDAEDVMRQLVTKLPSNLGLQVFRAGDVFVEVGQPRTPSIPNDPVDGS